MADSGSGAGKIQDDPGASCRARKKGSVQKNKRMQACKRNTVAKLKELQPKLEQSEQQHSARL